MNLQENIRRILREVRVPRSERVELYKDKNIIVVVPLTHRALQKYANKCQWCINSDLSEWEDYHQGKHAVIIQRNPKKPKIGITGQPTASEIFLLSKWDNGESSFEDVCLMLDYEFRNDRTMSNYYVEISNDINNFAINIVYYSPENGIYDQEDNFLWNFNYQISDMPNVTPEVIQIMDEYLQENEEMSLQESIRRILREDSQKKSPLLKIIKSVGLYDFMNETSLSYPQIRSKTGELSREIKIQYLKDVVKNLQQTPNELDLTFLVGSIPLKTSDDGTKTVYAEYLTKNNDVLNVHTAEFDFEGGVDNFNSLTEDELDDETLNVIVDELSLNLNDFNKR